ncbi:MAG: hypothetical protein A3J83_07985 [Elusimicrobia bacterium RIFOXYA2_FULL_40_6]|nr:MAG: hypothetical protein A3J83_07985 [Elusimicrobia bacterium RIFOXYA2_FULL_40_6]
MGFGKYLSSMEYQRGNMNNFSEKFQKLEIEVPSWGFGRGGTRFETYKTESDPKTVEEKIGLAGVFNKLTGQGKKVALHFPWDGSTKEDLQKLKACLVKNKLKAGAINSNMFSTRRGTDLNSDLRFGSLTSPKEKVRKASVEHNIDCIEIMRYLGSSTLVIWLPDGSNSPGQMSFYDQAQRLEKSLKEIYSKLKKNELLLLEYKLFEPGFYSTAVQDWGRALNLVNGLGKNAKVLVDLGHHAQGVNIEQIVAQLIREKKLGGFHFNDKKYADDDLATGSIDPAQLFRIFCILCEAEQRGLGRINDISFMIDQSHCIKNPFEELIESLENIEIAYAKALLVDYNKLKKYQLDCDISLADRILRSAFLEDVRPIIRRKK